MLKADHPPCLTGTVTLELDQSYNKFPVITVIILSIAPII